MTAREIMGEPGLLTFELRGRRTTTLIFDFQPDGSGSLTVQKGNGKRVRRWQQLPWGIVRLLNHLM